MKIHTIAYSSELPLALLECLVERLPEENRQKFYRYKKWEDAYNYLFGRYLLKCALADAGIQLDSFDLRYTEFGRPYLPGGPCFSISHSGKRAVCLLAGKGRVGVDLEEIKDLPVVDFADHFSAQEWKNIQGAASPLHRFYYYWTAKESILKADGRGLSIKLTEIDVTKPLVLLGDHAWLTQPIESFEGYACHIAHEPESDFLGIKAYSPADFIYFS